ncbi:putative hydroxylase [Gordonia effusa NBRC 100432]|uniref:Putative hydroxylase n=1 Tax=Gordonia effusa NBRC 100432 TaxID=1077974 RepID=H0R3J0_9ACTN|nr:acyl-CoA dehydrogenase family protein [Gordonia effusa]GAB19641.1 putative hydroxylase [Gordonia effusa NBRC 100432]
MTETETRATAFVDDALIGRLADRAAEGERLRRLPDDTVAELKASDFTKLLLPKRYGGEQGSIAELLQPTRRIAHGCTSTAWTMSFYALHVWMFSQFSERAQDEFFADGPSYSPVTLAPTGTGVVDGEGIRVSGRWSWATGVMDANWVGVNVIVTEGDSITPKMVVMPVEQVRVEDVWQTAGMRATGSNDIVVDDVWVPMHRTVDLVDLYRGCAPGALLYDAGTYRWPLVAGLALTAAMPVLGTAERVLELYTKRVSERVLAYSGVAQKDQPTAKMRIGSATIRLRAMRALIDDVASTIDDTVNADARVPLDLRVQARMAAAHVVHESRSLITELLESAGAGAHFLNNPLQRCKRDVDIVSGHAVFDFDISRLLAGTLAIGQKLPPMSMV